MVLFILILVGRAGGKTCYEYDTNTNTYKYEKNIKINWKLKFVLLDIYMYIFFLVGGGMKGVGGVGNMNQLYLYIYMTGYWNWKRCRSPGKGGVEFGIVTVIWVLVLGGMCFRCLSERCGLVRLYRAWFGNTVCVWGVEKGLCLKRVQQHWKQKRKTKDTKEIYNKW